MIDYVKSKEQSFSDWLKKMMKENKITSAELARGLSTEDHEVNRSTVSLWLSNSRTPGDPLMERLAQYLSSIGVWSYSPLIREIVWRVHVSKMRKK